MFENGVMGFNLEQLNQIFDKPNQLVILIIFAALIITSFVLLSFFLRSEKKRISSNSKHKKEMKQLTLDYAQNEAILASDEQITLIWPSQDDMLKDDEILSEKVRLIGQLQHVIGLPKNAKEILSVENWVSIEAQDQVQKALLNLAKIGEKFSFFVKTKAVERVELTGYVVGSEIIFKIRDLKEDRLFLARANEKWTSLEDQVTQFSALLNHSPLPSWLRNDAGKLIWINQAYIDAVEGEDRKTVLNDQVELLAPADIYKMNEYLSGEKEVSEEELAENKMERLSGDDLLQRLYVVIRGERCSLKVFHKKIDGGIVSTAHDITVIERTQDELKRYNKAHKQTLDKLKTAVAQFGPDQNLEFYNRSYQSLFELDPAFLDQKPSMSMLLEEIRKKGKIPTQSNFKQWRDKELEAFSQVSSNEHWWHLPNGTTLNIVSDPHPFGGVTFLYDDVTEHVNLERNFNKLDQTQTETLDNLTDGVLVFDSSGQLQISNPAFANFWQIEISELNKKPHVNQVLDWCKERSEPEFKELIEQLKTNVTSVMDQRLTTSGQINCLDGKIVDFASRPLPNSSTLMTFSDVTIAVNSSTLLNEHNEALLLADKLKTDFISSVSYQFREPLTNILGFTEMLESQAFGALNEKQFEYIDIIKGSSFGLRSLINDVLDLASLNAGRLELKIEDIQIENVIEGAVDALKMKIAQKNIVLNRIIMPKIGTFEGDYARISQVLFNLVSNAIYYSNDNSIVSIGAERDKHLMRVWVRDAGVGIAPKKMDKMRDEFGAEKPAGAGLGLSLVKKLVEFHDGSVKISSEENKGTIVSCYFPIEQKKRAPISQPPAPVTTTVPDQIENAKLDNIKLPKAEVTETEQQVDVVVAPKKLSAREQLERMRAAQKPQDENKAEAEKQTAPVIKVVEGAPAPQIEVANQGQDNANKSEAPNPIAEQTKQLEEVLKEAPIVKPTQVVETDKIAELKEAVQEKAEEASEEIEKVDEKVKPKIVQQTKGFGAQSVRDQLGALFNKKQDTKTQDAEEVRSVETKEEPSEEDKKEVLKDGTEAEQATNVAAEAASKDNKVEAAINEEKEPLSEEARANIIRQGALEAERLAKEKAVETQAVPATETMVEGAEAVAEPVQSSTDVETAVKEAEKAVEEAKEESEEDRSIFGNSRLAALYERSSKKPTDGE